MITDSYDISTEPMFTLREPYGEQRHLLDTCLILFSTELQQHLLDSFACERIATIRSCCGDIPIYQLRYEGERIAFYLSRIGSAMTAGYCIEAWWLTGATRFVMFGSCGSLDGEKTKGRFILPTEAYRGEGCSYYFAPPADYIRVRSSDRLARLFERLELPYVQGRVWTTDCMLRETYGLVRKRREEGCVAVEMEVAGVQAVCDFYGLELYDFLESGDVLDEQNYDRTGLPAANHSLGKLYIGLKIAAELERESKSRSE